MNIVERILYLVSKNQITKNKLLSDLELSKNSFINWQERGTVPSGDTVVKLAEYFGVTTDYLLGREDNKKAPSQLSEGAKALSEIEKAKTGEIMDLISRLDDNQLKIAKEYLDFLLMKQEQQENQ